MGRLLVWGQREPGPNFGEGEEIIVLASHHIRCAFGWLAHSRNSRLRLFTEGTQLSQKAAFRLVAARSNERIRVYFSLIRLRATCNSARGGGRLCVALST